MRDRVSALATSLCLFTVSTVLAGPLNDSGQTACYDATDAVADCASVAGDAGTRPRQDARFGRDPASAAGALAKTGAGSAGFDFTRICMSGEVAGTGSCQDDPPSIDPSNPGADEWACTRDNRTHLVWSIETIATGDWTDATTTRPAAYDATIRCGFATGWRAPTVRDLLSIVHHGRHDPAIDVDYFPNTLNEWYWSADEYAPAPIAAWSMLFYDGSIDAFGKSSPDHVRLVHGGP